MKLLVLSDSHGHDSTLRQALERHPEATVIFLGDGIRGMETVARDYPDRVLYAVPGNCDWSADGVPVREECFLGHRVLFTHGHLHRVKYGYDALLAEAHSRKAALALFGHTHQSLCIYEEGIWLLNPGSIADGSYGLVDVSAAGILPRIMRL